MHATAMLTCWRKCDCSIWPLILGVTRVRSNPLQKTHQWPTGAAATHCTAEDAGVRVLELPGLGFGVAGVAVLPNLQRINWGSSDRRWARGGEAGCRPPGR
jgi:hypothetical protein